MSYGERIPKPRFHDCAYVAVRNALIEQAEQLANDLITCCPPKRGWRPELFRVDAHLQRGERRTDAVEDAMIVS